MCQLNNQNQELYNSVQLNFILIYNNNNNTINSHYYLYYAIYNY